MKLSEALSKYRSYREELVTQNRNLTTQLKDAQNKAKATGSKEWAEKAATLQLSLDESNKKFEDNQKVLDSLIEQHVLAWNMEVAKEQADPENGMAATMAKIMTTVARMCAGDKVPYSDEKKVMEYDKDMYSMAKQAQMVMAAIKKRQKEYDSLWDDEEEGKKYDPKGVADNTEAAGVLPEIPVSEGAEAMAPEGEIVE